MLQFMNTALSLIEGFSALEMHLSLLSLMSGVVSHHQEQSGQKTFSWPSG